MTEEIEVGSLQDMAEEAPVVRLVKPILCQAVREGASDVHISPEKDYGEADFAWTAGFMRCRLHQSQ